MKYTKLLIATMIVCSLIFAGTTVSLAEQKEIKIGVMPWTPAKLSAYVIGTILKDRGYKVTEVEFMEWGLAFTALSRGDIDILRASGLESNTLDYWKKYKNKLEKVSVIHHGHVQGLVVPTYVTIDGIDQLNANKEKFKKKIVGIGAGSGLMRQTREVVKGYNLDFTLVEGSTTAMTASLKSALDKKEWIVVTLWTPTWQMMRYPLKFLKDPKGLQAPAGITHIASRKGFCQENPKAREILASLFWLADEEAKMVSNVNKGMKVRDAAAQWMKDNKDLLDRMLVIGEDKYK